MIENSSNLPKTIIKSSAKIPLDTKKKFNVSLNGMNVYNGVFSQECKLSIVRKHIQQNFKESNFFFLDNQSVPILLENENDFTVEEIVSKDEVINISNESCAPDPKKLLVLAIFAIILFLLIALAIYNPDNFAKIYILTILFGISFCK